MSFNVDNQNPGFNPREIGLVAPLDIGKEYVDPVTRPLGKPLGEGDNDISGSDLTKSNAVFKDVLETINTGDTPLTPQLLGFNLAVSLTGFQQLAQQQIDNLDPASPAVVLLPRFAHIFQQMMLKAGDLAGAEGALGEGKLVIKHKIAEGDTGVDISGLKTEGVSTFAAGTTTEAAKKAAAETSSSNPLGNPWMAGTAYTAFLVNYWEMLVVLKEMKEVDGRIQIEGMNMMVEMAKSTAEAIMDAAETRFWEHIAMAIVDGVSIGVTVACTAVSIGATFRMKAEVDTNVKSGQGVQKTIPAEQIKVSNIKLQAISAGAQGMGQSTLSAEKMANNIIQGSMELEAAQYDALKEVLQAFRQILQMQADRAQDAFKQNTDLITQMIQQIDAMRQKIADAQAKALSRSA